MRLSAKPTREFESLRHRHYIYQTNEEHLVGFVFSLLYFSNYNEMQTKKEKRSYLL